LPKKESKWYNSPLNKHIRELLEKKQIKVEYFAKKLDISPEAVRLWCGGYARPDMDKLPIISKTLNVSCDYLLGLSTTPSIEENTKITAKTTMLSPLAIEILKTTSLGLEVHKLLSDLIEDTAFIGEFEKFNRQYIFANSSAIDELGYIQMGDAVLRNKKEAMDYISFKCSKELAKFLERNFERWESITKEGENSAAKKQ